MAPIARIAVLFAMDAEARPLIDALGVALDADAFARVGGDVPMRVHSGKLKSGARVDVVCAGSCARHNVCNVGTVGAALSTYETCATLRPDVIVNAGTAGGFAKRGGEVGDVYVATKFKNHDRRIPIPGYDKYGVGEYDA